MRIEHIALFATDLEKTKEFFIKYFDAEANESYHDKETDFRSYFLTFSDGARLEIMTVPDLKQGHGDECCVGHHHVAFSVGSEEKVVELTNRLVADGYLVLRGPRTTGDGYFESCIEADGIVVEITV